MEHYERLYLISRHYVKEIKTISKGIPIFIGSVEQDPYTSAENVKKIEMNNLEHVTCHYFENTDFILNRLNEKMDSKCFIKASDLLKKEDAS